MKNYKTTLNMPSTDFPMQANLANKEISIRDRWITLDIYNLRLMQNKQNPQWILHDGPPYANGEIHIGHALNKILKDAIVRYKSMLGYYSPYIPGWDTHGLPIEHAVSQKEKENWNKISNIEKRKKCLDFARTQIDLQKKDFMQLGLLSDFKNCYYTFEQDYQINQLKIFSKMIDLDLVFYDLKPVYWSWSSKSALAEAEIEYKQVKSPSIYFYLNVVSRKFKNIKLLIWTTTPWTLPSNRAVAVNPGLEYCIVKVKRDKYFVCSNLLETIAKKLNWKKYKIYKKYFGRDLKGLIYQHPLYDIKCPIICADYVSGEDGTGLVHNAPGFGLEDYLACKENNIPVFCPIDQDGKFTNELNDSELVNVFYDDSNKIITSRLKKSKSLLLLEFIVHSAAHDWRTHQPVIYRATQQWFINLEKIKPKLLECTKEITTYQKWIKEHLNLMINNRKEWCISRQRIWGVPIPIIYDENFRPIIDSDLIKHVINVLEMHGVETWFEKDISFFLPDKYKDKKYFKCPDIMDVWFDSGTSFNILRNFDVKLPYSFCIEGADQFRGWFNSSLICGYIYLGSSPYCEFSVTGFTLDEKGNKMSKSLGNVIKPIEICKKYGADILRMLLLSNNYFDDLCIGNNLINQTVESYRKIRNTLFKFILGNLSDFSIDHDLQQEFELSEKVMLSIIRENIKKIDNAYEKFEFFNVLKIITKNITDYSGWYFEMIKDELYCAKKTSKKRRQIQTVLFYLLINYLIRLSPIIPHTCEEVFDHIKYDKKPKSIHLLNFDSFLISKNYDEKYIDIFDNFKQIYDKTLFETEKLRKQKIINKNSMANVELKIKDINSELTEDILKEWLGVSEVDISKGQEFDIVVNPTTNDKCERCWRYLADVTSVDDSSGKICKRCWSVLF